MIRDLDGLTARTFDVLIVGGGIYGLTIAADAAQRGLAVALIERHDFGSGSSFNHLRTIHGGLRYLQSLDFSRARESILERRTLARIAPHAVRPMPFVLPLTSRIVRGPLMMRAGLLLDAIVAADRNDDVPDPLRLPPGRVLSPDEARLMCPKIDAAGIVGAALWHDYVAVEADRLTLSWGIAAANHGALIANYVDATALLRDGPRITGARLVDRLTGRSLEVAARVIVNAAGPSVDALLTPLGLQTQTPLLRAMNLVTRLEGGDIALGGQAITGRALFMVPWHGRALFGTWESAGPCGADDLIPSDREVGAFLADVQTAFPRHNLAIADVTLVHRGIVPATRKAGGRVALEGHQQIVDHATTTEGQRIDGLISIAGTKYTTARAAAERVTDRLVAKLGRRPMPCQTASTPLPGASNAARGALGVVSSAAGARIATLPADVRSHLKAAYGPAQELVVAASNGDPMLCARIADAAPVLGAELVWAVRHEMAVTLSDAVLRRTPLGALGHPGSNAIACAAAVVGRERGWDAEQQAAERQRLEDFYSTQTHHAGG
jgi:glycerol-3-phosphate dehydrogenase